MTQRSHFGKLWSLSMTFWSSILHFHCIQSNWERWAMLSRTPRHSGPVCPWAHSIKEGTKRSNATCCSKQMLSLSDKIYLNRIILKQKDWTCPLGLSQYTECKKKKKKSFLNKEKFTLKEEKIGKNMPENDQWLPEGWAIFFLTLFCRSITLKVICNIK